MSPAIASCADSLISRGAGKSGNPCARLTAPYCIAWRVISRITDSVKCATLLLRNDFDRVRVSDMEVRVTGSAQAWPSRTSTAAVAGAALASRSNGRAGQATLGLCRQTPRRSAGPPRRTHLAAGSSVGIRSDRAASAQQVNDQYDDRQHQQNVDESAQRVGTD